ncbi:asparagine synthase (glutamine-hydrolyzing) [Candidatus Thioglobus sp.]|nr:asparagine synthase (glutamine-hydrolyzing) [Candidatus Thioglobus sp.]
MCGIAGVISWNGFKLDGDSVSGMLNAIRYRGKDDVGQWEEEGALLLHSRLTIIDKFSGSQPMIDSSDGYIIVFNGEIYNYLELREEYKKLGAVFNTSSDTEVILEGFKLKGESVCQDLNGMFAFAILDKNKRKLFIARDRIGKKPFFWTIHKGAFCFASSINAFKNIKGWKADYAIEALGAYGVFGSFPEHTSAYKNVNSLPPACHASLDFRSPKPQIKKYWNMSFHEKSTSKFNDLLSEYEDVLSDSIKIRLRSDVPIGLTFSGGVDSGTIAAICVNKLKFDINCYSIDAHSKSNPSDDVLTAERAAKHLGLSWKHIHYEKSRLLDDLDNAYKYYDQPCSQIPMAFTHKLYESIKPHATVVLTGNGADELFTGYIGDEKTRLKGLVLSSLSWLRPFFNNFKGVSDYLKKPLPIAFGEHLKYKIYDVTGNRNEFTEAVIDDLISEAIEVGAVSALDLKMFMSIKYRASESNYRVSDISGLASQVEVRTPYLDYNVVDFAARLPDKYKVKSLFSSSKNKFLPKYYYMCHVPKNIAFSKKKGMGWNIHFNNEMANHNGFEYKITNALKVLNDYSISSSIYEKAWLRHKSAIQKGKINSNDAHLVINGMMLGLWLEGNQV